MSDKKRTFIKVLIIELQNLHEDIETLIKEVEEKKTKGLISNYVFLENTSLFENEIFSIDRISKDLESFDTTAYADVDELYESLSKKYKSEIKNAGFAIACYEIINNRLKKIRQYLQEDLIS